MLPTPKTVRQWAVIDALVGQLQQHPAVELIWLEGSLALGKGNPCSDVDLWVAVRGEHFQYTFSKDLFPKVLEGFLITHGQERYSKFIRAISPEGVVVEMETIAITSLKTPPEAETLYDKKFTQGLVGNLEIRTSGRKPPAEAYPDPVPLTADWVRRQFRGHIENLAELPALFHDDEWESVLFFLDLACVELAKLYYKGHGVRYAKRYKHLSEVWNEVERKVFGFSHVRETRHGDVLECLLTVYRAIGDQLKRLSDKAGGGFDAEWWERITRQVEQGMRQFIQS